MRRALIATVLILFLAGGALAVGSSTGYETQEPQPPQSPDEQDTQARDDTQAQQTARPAGCEERASAKARIQCRLANQTAAENATPEGCRDIPNRRACVRLYEESEDCYAQRGRAKDRCFRQTAGVGQSVSQTARESPGAVRSYVVLLLYDLQERVEDAHGQGRVSSADAAELISGLVEAKQAVQSDERPAAVKDRVASVKAQWREVMG